MAKRKYITVNKKDHPKANSSGHVLLHVLVAEQKLGRYLKDGETVHHIDKNKFNNSPDNLMVFASSADHTLFHHGAEIYQDGDVWKAIRATAVCPVCNKIFYPAKHANRTQVYCSDACLKMTYRKTIDTEEIVKLLYENNGNLTRTAKELNVSANAIIHRLKRANLPYHSSDYNLNKKAN